MLVLSSVALISNIYLQIEEALTGKPIEKDTTFNREPSSDNGEVTALDLIAPKYCAGEFNGIGG